jgi:O-antigen/teichoic acid export membrane protein
MKDVNKKINQTFQVILCLALPMTIGLSFVTPAVWNIFYGSSLYGPITYKYLVFVAFATTLFTATTTTMQLLKEYKMVFITLIVGFLVKLTLNIPLMHLFSNMDIYPFYGAITATILGFVVSSLISIIHMKRKFELNYKSTIEEFKHIFVGVVLMLIIMFGLTKIIPLNIKSRVLSLVFAGIYAMVGGATYLIYTYKTNSLQSIFGEELFNKIKRKLKISK